MSNFEQLVQTLTDALATVQRYEVTQRVEKVMAKYLHPEQAKMGWGATAVTWPRENILDHEGIDPALAAMKYPDLPVWLRMVSRSEYVFNAAEQGYPDAETIDEVTEVEKMIEEHSLPFYGYTMLKYDPPGVCKVSAWACWPIPREVFEAAQAVDFIPDRYPDLVKYHLDIAHLAYRAHRTAMLPSLQAEVDKAGLRVRV